MRQLIHYLLLILSTSSFIACQKSSTTTQSAPPLIAEFSGTWSLQSDSGISNDSRFSENLQADDSKYMLIKIEPNNQITIESLGYESSKRRNRSEPQVYTGLTLSISGDKSGQIIPSEETFKQARRNGSSELEIEETKNYPCSIELESATTAKYLCKDSNQPAKLVKIGDAEVATLRTNSKSSQTKLNRVKKSISRSLGGTTWNIVEVKTRQTHGNGSPFDNIESEQSIKPEIVSSRPGGGSDISFNAKVISFSRDMETARINRKVTADIDLVPLRNTDTAKITFRIKTANSQLYQVLSQSGQVFLSEDKNTLTLINDYKVDKTRHQKWTVYTRAQ